MSYKKANLLFLVVLLINSKLSFSQKRIYLEDVKSDFQEKKIEKAKQDIDLACLHPKTKDLAETWYLRGLIYSTMEYDEKLNKAYNSLDDSSFSYFVKSFELSKEDYLKFVLTYSYGTNPALHVYNLYYKKGAAFYNEKKFKEALLSFQKAEEVNRFVALDGNSTRPVLDTPLVINLAVSAEGASDMNLASKYYGKIADARVSGESYAQIYKWLCYYYYKLAPDTTLMNKYLFIGKKLYPKDDFYSKIEIDRARNKKGGESFNHDDLFAQYESSLAESDYNNIEILNSYKVDLFNYLYPPGGKAPENSEDKVTRLEEIFRILYERDKERQHEIELDFGKFFYNIYFYRKSDIQPLNMKLNSLNEQLYKLKKKPKQAVNKSKSKPNEESDEIVRLSNEIKKIEKDKEKIKESLTIRLDSAIKYLELSFDYYYQKFKKGSMKGGEKHVLKSNIDLLTTCYGGKKNTEKEKFYDSLYYEIK